MGSTLAARVAAMLLSFTLLAPGCGRYRPAPKVWDSGAYRPASVAELKTPGKAGLAAGDLVKAPAYFWEFVIYDPVMVRSYLTMLRHPITWPQLQWFAVYETPQMHGYFDRVVMDEEQQRSYKLSRLDRILLYGELAPLGGGLLYLRVHRLEKLEEP
jgi:hypothetical protein